MVDALHTAFGEHHARAVHTKGVMLEGSFAPAPEAKTLTKEPIFVGGTLPVVSRFSLFAGVPTLSDTDDGASPAGFAVKIKATDGDDFDIESNQHKDFITATTDEFGRSYKRSVPPARATKRRSVPFWSRTPHARDFLTSRTYPASYATATYFGINALKFTNEKGQSPSSVIASFQRPPRNICRQRSAKRRGRTTSRKRS